jgi:hypothetical protein
MIGEFMFDYITKNNMKTGNTERKLTQLADTNDEFMSFSSYYLWYLIDKFHFVITDIKSLIVFSKQDGFNPFVNEFSFQRWKYKTYKSAKEEFFKISLNSSYGHDAMNTENYSKSYIQNEARANTSKLSDQFKNIRQLVDKDKDQTYDSIYQVDMDSDKFKCGTPLQQAYFTLDNAKYWFLVFIYEFMYKCMDMNRMHFIYSDTDSMYYAISGDPNEDYNQGFKHVVLDKEYYDKHVFKFLPFDTFCFQESSRPTISTMTNELLESLNLASMLSLVKSLGTDDDLKILNERIVNLKRTEQLNVMKNCLKANLKDNEKFIQISHD